MSDLKATVAETPAGFHVEGYEKISYDFSFVDGVFDVQNPGLANCYKPWGRVLAVTDKNVFGLYGDKMEAYFAHYGLTLKVHKTSIGEKAKTIDTFLEIADSMTDFGIIRKVSDLVPQAVLLENGAFDADYLLRSLYLLLAEVSSLMLLGKPLFFSSYHLATGNLPLLITYQWVPSILPFRKLTLLCQFRLCGLPS